MMSVEREFARRIAAVPHHGLGLSVDVYTPDLFDLMDALARGGAEGQGLACDYLEIFKAARPALAEVRRRLPDRLLEYHAEGLWVTQPDCETAYPLEAELALASSHARTLGSRWINHECATKQMAGYSFGTYLPPLFTEAGAAVAARHIGLVQNRLDEAASGEGQDGPLFLLELPPLTYFGFGDLSAAEFFRLVTDRVACGIVLDLGHLWTVYRYGGRASQAGCDLSRFLADFFEVFPLERVVQIHVAGLACHAIGATETGSVETADRPLWIDSHGAPIPDLLFDLLTQVLAQPRLRHLKGIALEVDNKAVPMIVEEFRRLRERFVWWKGVGETEPQGRRQGRRTEREIRKSENVAATPHERSHLLLEQYEQYVRVLTGGEVVAGPLFGAEPGSIARYRQHYFPHEILHWGGELQDMFPETCRRLDEAGIALTRFVGFWVREPRPSQDLYDFFLLKLERFVEFVREVLPSAAKQAEREAAELRCAYQTACERSEVPV